MREKRIIIIGLLLCLHSSHAAPVDEQGTTPTAVTTRGADTGAQTNNRVGSGAEAPPPINVENSSQQPELAPPIEQPDVTPSVIVVTPEDPRIPKDGCGIKCDDQFPVPVCGSDGQVYHSECVMRQITCGKDVTVADWEQCRGRHPLCPDKCLDIYDPVCGQDGKFYPNLCIMHRRNCGKHLGIQDLDICLTKARESRRLDVCPDECPEIYEPICASDGEVYTNECMLKKETCGQNIVQVPLTRCIQRPKCPKQCLPILDPVCGSDGKRYLNHCRLQEANCGKNVVVMPKDFCS